MPIDLYGALMSCQVVSSIISERSKDWTYSASEELDGLG